MKLLFIVPIIFICYSTSTAQSGTKSTEIHQVVRTAFEAFSEGSISKMEEVVTPDVRILEQGEVWTLDTIRTFFTRKRPADYKRVNTLEFFQTEVDENMAFVSYHNRADFHANNKDRTVKWLESAVLVKENGKWRIKMLHSTRKDK
jgi:uncharacterized protein (TIGR02246 family)